jgi:hypothetical protein
MIVPHDHAHMRYTSPDFQTPVNAISTAAWQYSAFWKVYLLDDNGAPLHDHPLTSRASLARSGIPMERAAAVAFSRADVTAASTPGYERRVALSRVPIFEEVATGRHVHLFCGFNSNLNITVDGIHFESQEKTGPATSFLPLPPSAGLRWIVAPPRMYGSLRPLPPEWVALLNAARGGSA